MKKLLLSGAVGNRVASFLTKTSLAAMLALAAISAKAEVYVAEQGDDSVRIYTDTSCKDEKVIAAITAQGADPSDFREAKARVGGKSYAACATPLPQGILVVYEDGDMGLIPGNAFHIDNKST